MAGCAVNPVTPPAAVGVSQQTVALATASPAIASDLEAALNPTALPPATQVAASAAAQPTVTVAAAGVTPAATAGVAPSPTPVLIVVAEVALVPAPTATMPPVVVSVTRLKPTSVPLLAVAPPVSSDAAAAELYTVDLINAQRAALGLAALSASPALMGIANSRVADMVARGYTGHNDPVTGVPLGPALMMAAGFDPIGENWYGSRLGPPAIADVAMKWFMTDAPHYQNILNPHYTGVGVGIAYNGKQWLLVQDFGGS